MTIQGQVTYRVGEPKRLAALLNYTLAPNGQTYASEDPEKLPERVIHVVNVLARAELQKMPLREAIAHYERNCLTLAKSRRWIRICP